jgi:UDP-N-acetylglucosamine 2-epimerase (non-hydrolysing)
MTERPITVSEGTNRVLGVGADALEAFREAVREAFAVRPAVPERWDGRGGFRAAEAIVERHGTAAGTSAVS